MATNNDYVICRNDNNSDNNNNAITNYKNRPSQYDQGAIRLSLSCQNGRSEAVLKAYIRKNEGEIRILEDKLIKQEQTKEEVEVLHMRLEDLHRTIEEMVEDQKQTFENVSCNLDTISAKYEKMRNTIHQLKKENHELQCSIHEATAKELKNVDKIKKLEINKAKAIECNKEHQETLQKLQEHSCMLKEKQGELEHSIECLEETANRSRYDLAEMETSVQSKSKQLFELQRWNDEIDQTLKELSNKLKERQEELEACAEASERRLAQANRQVTCASSQLADAAQELADTKAKHESAATAYRELKTCRDAEVCRTRAVIDDLNSERGRMADAMSEASCRLASVETDNRLLSDDAQVTRAKLACLTHEVNRLEQWESHGRLVMEVERTKAEAEIKLLREERTIKLRKLEFIEADVERLVQNKDEYEQRLKQNICQRRTSF